VSVNNLTLDQLLAELRHRKWTLHLFGPQDNPNLYAATFQWDTHADVFILWSEQEASAYRVPTFPNTDVFLPEVVAWQYFGAPEWVLRAVLTIGAPGTRDAPMEVLTPNLLCSIPREIRRPVTMRPTGLVQRPTSSTWF
jgi:hypothetical protein